MSSNSKLTPEQKISRKVMLRAVVNRGGRVYSDGRVTLCLIPEFAGSRMMRVSVSVISPDELKFRRKVGEYHALSRMFDRAEFIIIPSWFNDEDEDECFFESRAFNLAYNMV